MKNSLTGIREEDAFPFPLFKRHRNPVQNLLAIVLFTAPWLLLTTNLRAQSKPASPPDFTRSLNERQTRGENLFLQRCSLCHLAQATRLMPNARPYGPSLTGLLKDAGVAKQKAVRETISKGGPRMPGFQFGLSPAEMDDLMEYLKTL